jgi:hypothetical protein
VCMRTNPYIEASALSTDMTCRFNLRNTSEHWRESTNRPSDIVVWLRYLTGTVLLMAV